MAGVQLKQVVKSYDAKNTVIHGVDLEVRQGEFVVFVGPSGCGKSTLLRMIAGLESISGGDVIIDGRRVNDEPPRARDIAMVFQDYALYRTKVCTTTWLLACVCAKRQKTKSSGAYWTLHGSCA